jgi:hypothetical protein
MGRIADAIGRAMTGLEAPGPHVPPVMASSSSTLQSVTIAQALLSQNVSRDLAMSVPTIERARDVLVGIIGSLPLRYWSRRPVGVEDVEREPEQWMFRPDPNRTRTFMVGWTVDDLIFYGRAYWRITARYENGFPSTFEWMPYTETTLQTEQGRQWGTVIGFTWRGKPVDLNDVVVFDGLSAGLLSYGWRAISIAIELDAAALRFATAPVPMGWLRQTEGEPYTSEELDELADEWHSRRLANVTAAIGTGIVYEEGSQNPERLQLMEARQHQALELARMMNVPPWVVGAPQGAAMTYQNAMTARLDLIDFGALPHVSVIEETLSGPNVTPRGSYVKLDTDAWLRNPLLATPGASVEPVPERGDQLSETSEVPA